MLAKFFATATAVAAMATHALADLDPIVIKGSKFFYKSNGTQFFIRGVAYQQDVGQAGQGFASANFVDPLGTLSICQRDIPYLQKLRTNTIRVYATNPYQNHDACFDLLQKAGIYVLADLSAPNVSIITTSPQWNQDLKDRYTSVIDTLAGYSNVIGFFAGNEVATNETNTDSMAFVKAAIRDTKAYIKQKGYNKYVGYAADDSADIRFPTIDYVNCGSDQSAAIDFFGYNIYSWCGDSNYETSGYKDRTAQFSNYSVPAFFAEYGCNQPSPRKFAETIALYGSDMTKVWSGGIVYQYFQGENNFGLASVSGNTVSTLADFDTLSTQIAKVNPTGVAMGAYSPSNNPRACPTNNPVFDVAASPLPPSPDKTVCSCMVSSLSCVANTNVDTTAYGALFNVACGSRSGICDGISGNGTSGKYGAFSMCSSSQRLSWALNAYFQDQKSNNPGNNDACSFGGNATVVNANVASTCTSALASASNAASSGNAATSSAAATSLQIDAFDFGVLRMGAYVAVAMLAGAGIVLM